MYHRHDDPRPRSPIGRRNSYPCINPMTPARQQGQATLRLITVLCLGENTAATGDHGVGCEHETVWLAKPRRHRIAFSGRQAKRMVARAFGIAWSFVDIRFFDARRLYPELTQQVKSSWRGRREDQGGFDQRLFETVGDTSAAQIIGCHLDRDLVAGQHADAILTHTT